MFTISVAPRRPARPRESIACGVRVSASARIASAIPEPPVEHGARRLWRDVARREACAACCQHTGAPAGKVGDRGRDLVALVGHDPALDAKPSASRSSASVSPLAVFARAVMDAVRDRQHGGVHTASFVFSTRVTSEIGSSSLSIAFAMS